MEDEIAEPKQLGPVTGTEQAVQELALEWADYTGLIFSEADQQAIYQASIEWEKIYEELKEAGSSWEERSPYLGVVAILQAIGIDRVVFEIEDHTKLFTYFNEDSLRLAIQPTYPDEYRRLYARYGDL